MTIRTFAFDRVFEHQPTPEPGIGADEARLKLAALEAEYAALVATRDEAVELARAEGYEAGLSRARAERDAALLAATDALHAALEGVDARLDAIAEETAREAAMLARAAADMLAARAISEMPGAAIDEAIGRALSEVARGQEIHISVHPDLRAEVERLVERRQAGDRRRLNLHVVPDATLAFGDAHLQWHQGGVRLDAAARAEAVRAMLEQTLPMLRKGGAAEAGAGPDEPGA